MICLYFKYIICFGLLFLKSCKIYGYSLQLDIPEENKNSNALMDLLSVAESVLVSAKQYAKIRTNSRSGYPSENPMDCAEIFEKNVSSKSGVYKIWPRSRVTKNPVGVYCDMEDDGGAWTVIQSRGNFDNPEDYFYRDWISYRSGFGDPLRDFWVGNDNIFALTNERACSLKFSLADWEGNRTFALYDEFWIDDESHNYVSHVARYGGNAGDSFSFTNGIPFSTKDKDNDKHNSSCAVNYKGAWWYAACHSSNLNGMYMKGPHDSYADGVEWSSFRGQKYSLKDIIVKIRPRDFRKTLTPK